MGSRLIRNIMPIFHYCIANKGDINSFRDWQNSDDAVIKMFYAYYAELFFRILYMLNMSDVPSNTFYQDCENLLKKYDWFDIHKSDLQCFVPDEVSVDYCEVPDALLPIKAVDMATWKTRAGNNRAMFFLSNKSGNWTFADARGIIYRMLGVPY